MIPGDRFLLLCQRSTHALFLRDLIDFVIRSWKVDIVSSIFFDEGAVIILNMPIMKDSANSLSCYHTSHRDYIVQYGYKVTLGLG